MLVAFSKSDREIGYVQGMNFVVASLTYHCREDVAFWIFKKLLGSYSMREIYQPGLPGLYRHAKVLSLLVERDENALWERFRQLSLSVEMFASDWLFCLFCSAVPLESMRFFYEGFLREGWLYFYKLAMAVLGTLR